MLQSCLQIPCSFQRAPLPASCSHVFSPLRFPCVSHPWPRSCCVLGGVTSGPNISVTAVCTCLKPRPPSLSYKPFFILEASPGFSLQRVQGTRSPATQPSRGDDLGLGKHPGSDVSFTPCDQQVALHSSPALSCGAPYIPVLLGCYMRLPGLDSLEGTIVPIS